MPHRFYAPPARADKIITLDQAETHHLRTVLRLSSGAEVLVFDGRGAEYRCVVRDVTKSAAQLEIIDKLTAPVESPLSLTLYQALPKGEKFDLIIQKTTELGVHRIVPIITEYSEVKLKEEVATRRLERWQRIALEAVKQCGRRRLVELVRPLPFAQALTMSESDYRIMLAERGGHAFAQLPASPVIPPRVALFVGPEGGWHETELAAAQTHGCHLVTVGPRILRTETAAIAAVVLAQAQFGDLT